MKNLFARQVVTLTVKNILIALVRHRYSTPFRAFLLPCIFVGFLYVGLCCHKYDLTSPGLMLVTFSSQHPSMALAIPHPSAVFPKRWAWSRAAGTHWSL